MKAHEPIEIVTQLHESYETVRELLGGDFDSATRNLRCWLLRLMNEQRLSVLAAGGVLLRHLKSEGGLSAWQHELVLATVYSLYLPREDVDHLVGSIAPIGAASKN